MKENPDIKQKEKEDKEKEKNELEEWKRIPTRSEFLCSGERS